MAVDPDVSNFQQALDEELGGITLTIPVLPDIADFRQAVDEETGGMSAIVTVGADTTPAEGEVASFLEDIDTGQANLNIGADTGAASEQAAALAEEVSGLSADLNIGAGGAGLGELEGELEGVEGAADTAAAGISGLTGAISGASGEVPVLSNEVGELNTQLDALGAGFGAGLASHLGDASGIASQLAAGIEGAASGAGASVPVTPDMTGFAERVEEESAGITAPVRVIPDMTDFGDALAEEAGGGVTIPVIPDAEGFTGRLDEQLAGQPVIVPVDADTGPAQEQIAALGSQSAGLAEAGADAQALATGLDEAESSAAGVTQELTAFRELTADSFGSVDYTQLAAGLNGVADAESQAAAEADSVRSDFAELGSEFAELSGELSALDQQFLAFAADGDAPDATLLALSERLESLYAQFGAVGAEIEAMGAEFSAAGADISGADAQLGLAATMLRELESDLAETTGTVNAEGAAFFALQEQAARLGVTLEGLPAALEEMDAGLAASADARAASLAALNAETAEVATTEDTATTSANRMGGAFGFLSTAMDEVMANPFTWVAAAAAGGIALGVALDGVTDGIDQQIEALQRQDDAVGYNISGYQELAAQLGDELKTTEANADAQENLSTHMGLTNQQLGHAYAAQSALTGAQQAALTAAGNLSTHLGTLETQYDLTQTQAEALATAAGVSAKTLTGSGEAADKAMGKIESYANANLSATGPVGQLTTEMETFDNQTLNVTSRVTALDDAYNTLTGNFVSSWQSQLQVTQDFQALASNAEQAGASMKGTNTQSTDLQTSFAALPSAIEQTANAMSHEGDSVTQVSAYIDQQIGKLSGLTGGNAEASQAVQGLKEWEDKLEQSMDSQDAATTKTADDLQDKFTTSVEDAGLKSSTAKSDVDNLTDSILATGTKSDETAAARAQLIKDLERSGVSAQQATKLVDGFITSIGNIPSSKQVTLSETATGTWSVQQAQSAIERGPGSALVPGHAYGGLIQGGSGNPRADDVLIRASHNEYMVQADAVDHYGVGMMDAINAKKYAAGGLVGSYSGPLGGLGAWTDNQYSSSVAALTQELEGITSQGAANAAAAAQSTGSGRPPVIINFNGTQVPSAEMMAEIERRLAMAVGGAY